MYNPRVLGMSAGNVVQAPVDKLANELTQRLAAKTQVPGQQPGMQQAQPPATQASNPSSMVAPLQGNSTSTTPTGGLPSLNYNHPSRGSTTLPQGLPNGVTQAPQASRWQGQDPPKQDMVSSGGGGWSQTMHAPNVTQGQTIAPVGGTITPWQHPVVPYANSPSTVKPDQTGMDANNGALGQGGSAYGESSGKGQQGHQKKQQQQQGGGTQQQQQQGQETPPPDSLGMFYGQADTSGRLTPAQLKAMYLDGKLQSATLDSGEQGYYDPATHTTYNSKGEPVIDKKGYSEDGTPYFGDVTDPANFYSALDGNGNPIRGPHGEQISRNPDNGVLSYYDTTTKGYVRVGPDGVPVDLKTGAPIPGANAANNEKPAPTNPMQSVVDYYNNNPPPQFNQQAIDDQVNAAKQQRAIQGGQDSRSLMALAANSGTNPDAAQANLGQMSAETNAQGAASDAKLRMQGELTKLQQETKWYDDKANALRLQAAAETDKSAQASMFIMAQMAASAAASRQEDMMKMQIELSKPSVGEMIGGGFLGLLTGGLSSGLGRLIGGFGSSGGGGGMGKGSGK